MFLCVSGEVSLKILLGWEDGSFREQGDADIDLKEPEPYHEDPQTADARFLVSPEFCPQARNSYYHGSRRMAPALDAALPNPSTRRPQKFGTLMCRV